MSIVISGFENINDETIRKCFEEYETDPTDITDVYITDCKCYSIILSSKYHYFFKNVKSNYIALDSDTTYSFKSTYATTANINYPNNTNTHEFSLDGLTCEYLTLKFYKPDIDLTYDKTTVITANQVNIKIDRYDIPIIPKITTINGNLPYVIIYNSDLTHDDNLRHFMIEYYFRYDIILKLKNLSFYDITIGENCNKIIISNLSGSSLKIEQNYKNTKKDFKDIVIFKNNNKFKLKLYTFSNIDVNNIYRYSKITDLYFYYCDCVLHTNYIPIKSLVFENCKVQTIDNDKVYDNSIDARKYTNIEVLKCPNCHLRYLLVSGLNKLSKLIFSCNMIKNIALSGLNELKELDGSKNQLYKMFISHYNKLELIDLCYNTLVNLRVHDNPKLISINVNNNQIHRIYLSNIPMLHELKLSNNNLQSIFVNHLTSLKILECENNQLVDMNTYKLDKLNELNCSNNNITRIIYNDNLKKLLCRNNKLKLVAVRQCLDYLDCSNNNINNIVCYQINSLRYLNINNNHYEDKTGLTKFTNLIILNCKNINTNLLELKRDNEITLVISSDKETTFIIDGLTSNIISEHKNIINKNDYYK